MKTKQLIRKISDMNFVAVAIVSAIVLGHHLTKEPCFDWFKSDSPLFESQLPDHQGDADDML